MTKVGKAQHGAGQTRSTARSSRLARRRRPGRRRRAGPCRPGGAACCACVISLYSTLATSCGSTNRVSFGGCVPVNGLSSRASDSSMRLHALELGLGEAGADAARVAQLAVLDRSRPRARRAGPSADALAGQPAADHDVGGALVLDLHPALASAAPGCTGSRAAWPRSPRAPAPARRPASPRRRRRGAPAPATSGPERPSSASCRPARLVGLAHQRVAVEPQQVEDHVDDRLGLARAGAPGPRTSGACAAAGAGSSGARPSSATTSPSSTASCAPSARPELAQLRVARRDVVAVAALQPQPAALGVADRAHAVPLDLVGPVGVVARAAARCARASARSAPASAPGPGPPAGPSGGSSSSCRRSGTARTCRARARRGR